MTDHAIVERCDNCGGARLELFGESHGDGVVHGRQLRCRDCGLVLAAPRLRPDALRRLYASYQSELGHGVSAEAENARRASARRLLDELATFRTAGRLLDVGCGTGSLLVEARARGFEVTGVEPAADGIAFARTRYGLDDVRAGLLEDADLPEGAFDVVVAYHVVEHVFDLDATVARLRRLLVADGVLVIGTEAYDHPSLALLRAARRVRGRTPEIATSSQHTFVFGRAVLRDVFERRGFQTLRVRAYDELPLRQRLRAVEARTPARRAAARLATALPELAARATRRGPYLLAFFARA